MVISPGCVPTPKKTLNVDKIFRDGLGVGVHKFNGISGSWKKALFTVAGFIGF